MQKTLFSSLAVLFLGLLSGCSVFQQTSLEEKKLELKANWVRVLNDRNQGYLRSHRMKPVLHENYVIQGNGYNGLYALDRKSGKMYWSFPVENGVEGGAAVQESTVYFGGGDTKFYALDLATGKKKWSFDVKSQVLSAPAVAGSYVFFLSGNNTVFALDTETGQQKWLYRRPQTTNLTVRGGSQPVIRDGKVYIGMSDGYLVSLDVSDGGLFWERPLSRKGRFIDIDATPLIHKGRIYTASYDGSLFCLNLSDGKVLWQLDEGGASAPILVKDKLFYSTTYGDVLSVQAKDGKLLWRYKLPQAGIATTPRHYRGHLLFGESTGPLRVLSSRTGQPLTSYTTGRGVSAEPFVTQKGHVFVISNQGYVYALQLVRAKKTSSWQ